MDSGKPRDKFCSNFQFIFSYAWTLVEAAKEREKADRQRRSGYREVDRVSLELHLFFSPDPVYMDLEQLRLADSLMFLCEKLGADDSMVVKVLGELVGLVFYGNLDGLVNRVRYDDVRSRAVSVDSSGMLEALRYVYRAEELAEVILASCLKRKLVRGFSAWSTGNRHSANASIYGGGWHG